MSREFKILAFTKRLPRIRRHSALTTPYSLFRTRRPSSAFTLIELMVAVGLMALMMSMIATIFFQATQAFSLARAGVEVHQNARAAYGMMLNDLAAAKLCEYEDKTGYFALSWERTVPNDGTNIQPYYYTPAITFTTLADQAGATPLVPGVTPQVALVRYCLEWDGGQATIKDDDPLTTDTEETYTRPTYNLIKRVRFPQLPYYFVDMNEFDEDFTPDEVVTSDLLALGVISMKVRVYYKGDVIDVSDYGRATGGGAATLDDSEKTWTLGPSLLGQDLRILGGASAPQAARTITGATDTQITTTGFSPSVTADSTYRIENGLDSHTQPTWVELQDRGTFDFSSGTYTAGSYGAGELFPMRVIENVAGEDVRMPYIVEVTLELTDRKSITQHTFSERFYIPSSEMDY